MNALRSNLVGFVREHDVSGHFSPLIRLCEGITDIRGTVCDHGHFYASADAAAGWHRRHPDGDVAPVGDFFTLALAAHRELGWIA